MAIYYSKIPNFKNIGPQYKGLAHDPEQKYSIPWMAGTVGIVMTAWALDAFLIPNRIAAGGVAGLLEEGGDGGSAAPILAHQAPFGLCPAPCSHLGELRQHHEGVLGCQA